MNKPYLPPLSVSFSFRDLLYFLGWWGRQGIYIDLLAIKNSGFKRDCQIVQV